MLNFYLNLSRKQEKDLRSQLDYSEQNGDIREVTGCRAPREIFWDVQIAKIYSEARRLY